MIKFLSSYFNVWGENERLRDEIGQLKEAKKEKTKVEEPALITSSDLVNAIMERPIEWVNWKALPQQERNAWSQEAQQVLRNRAFISLCGSNETNGELVKVLIEHIARYTKNHDETRDMRMTISGIELIRENLEAMVALQPLPSKDNVHSVI
jgi:hypothetical protein